MRIMKTEAKKENLKQVMGFVDECLEEAGCSMRAQMQIDIAVEEIFVNIANYAYTPGIGEAQISISIIGEPAEAVIEFRDRGIAFDPLEKADPDTSLTAEQRQIGGLGIFMVKKSMNHMSYIRKDGQNILTIRKTI